MKARPSNRLNDNGPPPNSAASLFTGTVMHHRMKPREHRFSYKVFSVLLDLDRLDEAARSSPFFSVNRFNLLSFYQKDHGPRDGADLRTYVNELLLREGLDAPARIMLLAYPRMLGYGFNPLSVYYAYDQSDRLIALVYEVRNTFGGMHTYVAPVLNSQSSDAGIRQDQKKLFYVSPFISMEQHYFFRMLPPGNTVRVRILEKDTEGPVLSATFSGTRSPLNNRSILRACLRVPLLTYKVIGAIHWEAFKIWRKRVPFHARPTEDAGKDGSTRQAGNVLPVINN
jgi:DUF1365 family protein